MPRLKKFHTGKKFGCNQRKKRLLTVAKIFARKNLITSMCYVKIHDDKSLASVSNLMDAFCNQTHARMKIN